MTAPVPPVPDEPGPAGDRAVCDHFYVSHCCRGMSVGICSSCHQPDWDDLERQLNAPRSPETPAGVSTPDDSGRAFSGAHAQAQRRAGAVPALPPGAVFDPESFGRLVHRVRLDFNAAMDKPFGLLPWERRHPSQQALDIRIGETVAGYALEQNAATWDLLCPRCASFLDRANSERERAERAEAKLAVIAERCKQPDQLLGTQVLVDRDAILAIISSEEGDSRG